MNCNANANFSVPNKPSSSTETSIFDEPSLKLVAILWIFQPTATQSSFEYNQLKLRAPFHFIDVIRTELIELCDDVKNLNTYKMSDFFVPSCLVEYGGQKIYMELLMYNIFLMQLY